MSSDCPSPSYSLQELISLNVFRKEYGTFGFDTFATDVTAWAENQVMAGSQSETLLILASLNLEHFPDRDEVELYLARYQQENGMANPDKIISTLIWLRIRLQQISDAVNVIEVEYRLAFFTQVCLDFSPRAFGKITGALSSLYWELYDEALPVFQSRASEMSEEELFCYVRERINPWLRILRNDDWIWVLVR